MKTRAVDVMTEHTTEYTVVERDSEEWHSMWAELSRLPCNKELEPLEEDLPYGDNEDGYGEEWQYIVSFYAPLKSLKNATGDGWVCVYVHEFRHRCHPTLEEPVTVRLQASDAFTKAMDEKAMKEQEVEE